MLPKKAKQAISSTFPPHAQQQQHEYVSAQFQSHAAPGSPTRHLVQDSLHTGYRHSLSPTAGLTADMTRSERSAKAQAILLGNSPCTPADALLFKEHEHMHHSAVIPQPQPQQPQQQQQQHHSILLDRHDAATPEAVTPDSAGYDDDEHDDSSAQSSHLDSDEHDMSAVNSGDDHAEASQQRTSEQRAGAETPSELRKKKKKKPAKSSNAVLPEELQGHYVVTEYLGSGSYGHVYLANPTEAHPLLKAPSTSSSAGVAATPAAPGIPSQVAIKKIVHIFDNLTNAKRLLREIKILRMLSHSNIISFKGLLPPPTAQLDNFNDLSMVFEYVDTDLQKLIHSNQHFSNLHIQFFLYQLLCGLEYMHSGGVIHRDLKPANVLVNADCSLKICDFGLSRLTNNSRISASQRRAQAARAGSDQRPGDATRTNSMDLGYTQNSEANTPSKRSTPEQCSRSSTPASEGSRADSRTGATAELPSAPRPTRTMTKHVVTRWYRAPELILLSEQYSTAIDMWSLGCILAELLSMQQECQTSPADRQALFPGRSCFPLSAESPLAYADQLDQLNVIFDVLGTPHEADLTQVDNVTARNYIAALPKKRALDLAQKFRGSDPLAIDLLQKLLRFNPTTRFTATQALQHPYLAEMREGQTNPLFSMPSMAVGHEGWDFEDETLDEEKIRSLILEEIMLDNPALREKLQGDKMGQPPTAVPILKCVPTRPGSGGATSRSELPPLKPQPQHPVHAASSATIAASAAPVASAVASHLVSSSTQHGSLLHAPVRSASPTSATSSTSGYLSSSSSGVFTSPPSPTRVLSGSSSQSSSSLISVPSSGSISSSVSVSPEPPHTAQHHAMLPLPHPQHAQASSFLQPQSVLSHTIVPSAMFGSAPQIAPADLAAPPTPTMDDLAGSDHHTVSLMQPLPQQPLQHQQQQQLFQQSTGFPYSPVGPRPEITICITSCETPMPPRPHEQLDRMQQQLLQSAALMQQQQQQPVQQQSAFAPAQHSSLPFVKSAAGPVFDSMSTGMTPQTAHMSLAASSSLQSSTSAVLAFAPPPPTYVAGLTTTEALPAASVTVAAGVMPRVQRPKRRHDDAAALAATGHA